jgi:mannose-6-phosphate isomerase-like protein (cupin superfamily)
MTALVARAAEIPPERTASGSLVTTLLDTRGVGGRLIRRLVEVQAGAGHEGTAGPGGELWFVISGSGDLETEGQAGRARISTDHGVLLPAGTGYVLHARGPAPVRLDSVALPGPAVPAPDPVADGGPPGARPGPSAASGGPPLVSDLGECEVERTGDRRFRVLFGPGRRCAAATQFVGEIPPGRAGVHSHAYDEVVLVLAGTGVAHVGGAEHPLTPGTCVYLPPGQQHCLENTGPATLHVLGVFQPGGSPAAKKEAAS